MNAHFGFKHPPRGVTGGIERLTCQDVLGVRVEGLGLRV